MGKTKCHWLVFCLTFEFRSRSFLNPEISVVLFFDRDALLFAKAII